MGHDAAAIKPVGGCLRPAVGKNSLRHLAGSATPPSTREARGRGVFKAGSRTVWHWPSPAGTVHASVNPPIPLPLVAGTTLAFPSGEGGPLAVDEENTYIAAFGSEIRTRNARPYGVVRSKRVAAQGNKSLSLRERWRRSRRRGCPPSPAAQELPPGGALVCVFKADSHIASSCLPRRGRGTTKWWKESPPYYGSWIRTCPPSRQAERSQSLQGLCVQGV